MLYLIYIQTLESNALYTCYPLDWLMFLVQTPRHFCRGKSDTVLMSSDYGRKTKKNESPNQIAQCKLQASLSRWINCTWCVLLSNSCVLRAISLVSSHFWWMFHGIYEIRQLNTETLSPGNVGMGSCRFDGIQGKYHWDIPQIPTISSKS